ncbi:MAG TPA: hypothetical protein EYG68_09945 [Leucothrix mucor]|nr:hypothetical protein [Leucothrix mucor]
MLYNITLFISATVLVSLLTACGGGGGSSSTPNTGVRLDLDKASNFVSFESGHVRPLAKSLDGKLLFAVNTPANSVEIFNITATGLEYANTVAVGMEPVAIAVRSQSEIWVVNHLSDSISIVDLSAATPRVTRTLLVGDEPRDIVFAGTSKKRAFITTAHRGQNSPYGPATLPNNPSEATTAGIGRADVWVFDSANLGATFRWQA